MSKDISSTVQQSRFDKSLYVRVLLTFTILLGANSIQPATAASTVSTGPVTSEAVEIFFDAMLAQQMADEHVVGATVSVVKNGELLFAKGYGYADLENETPVVAEETLFFPGSAGKLFTWTALMQLVDQGQVDLADDVNQYLDFEIPATFPEPITIEHLLTHTTGFEEQFAALLVDDQAAVLPIGEFLERTLPARVYAPGTTFGYSNYATNLAGYIVERVSGEPFEQYVTNHILIPLVDASVIYMLIVLAFGSLLVTVLLGFAHDSYSPTAPHPVSALRVGSP
jgi:CubicO group peptidase (beta-lactamase class C family)